MEIQNVRRGSFTRKRREENIEWVKRLSLDSLEYNRIQRQVLITRTKAGEEIALQYPEKESIQGMRRWKNIWDFRPKLMNRENVDLTFEQIWDQLYEKLRSLPGERRRRVGSVLATLCYRIAYMNDYVKGPDDKYATKVVKLSEPIGKDPPQSKTVDAFWAYAPPLQAVEFVEKAVPKWADMSFEAFLHYNSLLAWNEDMRCLAKIDDWSAGDPRGRINTLLTYIRVIGFAIDEVRISTLLGGFVRLRGMSMAEPGEIRRICAPFVN